MNGTGGAIAQMGTGGSGGVGDAPDAGGTETDAPVGAAAGPFEARALAIAAEYKTWGRVDDELRWAPFLCRIPYPGVARPSASNDETTHGRKLYSVFVKNREAYPMGPHADQVVVKESWTAEPVEGPGSMFRPEEYRLDGGVSPDADHFYPYAQADGGVFRAGAPAGLYIMFKLDPTTPDTDLGWGYATITKDGVVTASGRVGSCMGCHEDAPHERLFGVPKSPFTP